MTDWDAAMARALELAVAPDAPRGLNPRVGCVIIGVTGDTVGEGYHRGAGTPHAEVQALDAAGVAARGATAVVTLEPCRHVGRTGPCVQALMSAGVSRVVFAQADPTAQAGGGAGELRAGGIEVIGGVLEERASLVNRGWTHVQRTGRPLVTLKIAATLDGRVADASGGPTPISGPESAIFVHTLRSEMDVVLVGTGTAVIDNPRLTVREIDGRLADRQPLRAVMGVRDLPSSLRLFDDDAPSVHLRTRAPGEALGELAERGVQHVLLEGGPSLAAAFLDAGFVDEVVWLLAPRLFGSGPVAIGPMSGPIMVDVREFCRIGDDVLVRGAPRAPAS
jgi:diaminohydroxyphosphoribosylaminopyrimidine deaminase/5-amino-6-(5-phosphoribosylamino)uracil reductase